MHRLEVHARLNRLLAAQDSSISRELGKAIDRSVELGEGGAFKECQRLSVNEMARRKESVFRGQ